MKRYLILVAAALLLLLSACSGSEEPAAEKTDAPPAESEQPPDRDTAEANIGGARVSINYGRPSLQGRDMLGQLPDGQVWRLGMNNATELETTANIVFGETVIEAGKYSLFAMKVNAEEWHLIVNSATGIWGTEYNSGTDVAHIPLQVSTNADSVETFTINLRSTGEMDGEIQMDWSTLKLAATFRVE